MVDAVDELIKEIALKHGTAVSRDDPIMVLHTINARLLEDSAKAQQAMLDSFKEELESIAFRWGEEAKGKAERILNAALSASRETMSKSMQESAQATAASIKTEVEAALRRITIPMEDAKRLAMYNVVAAGLTFFSAAIVVFALL